MASANSDSMTHEVKQKLPNSHGLYDMSGNVWEWCQDWYGANQYATDGNATDPVGASSGNFRVLRGGSWSFNASYCAVSFRSFNNPDDRNNLLGFRVVRSTN